ncbi:MAG: hypothetical protein PWP07_2279 [Epulopiscium sp.]|jgi:glycosyltransferase involved in cell wall biosynthesis|nr:hypothetical protein [Candidatus Epulonipiscium sp.]
MKVYIPEQEQDSMENKLTLITTVRNEEHSIEYYIQSILFQTRPPDEIIVVDGGSKDQTVPKIQEYIKNGAPIKLIIDENANIAKGRNIAISNASHCIILSTDAGCKLSNDWVENISKPFFEQDADVVAGFYKASPENFFEKCVSEFTLPTVQEFNMFQPSSRSIAFTKQAWEKVGGYPEWLYTAEDTLFNIKLKEAGCKFVFAKDAVVYWRPRRNFKELFKQYFLYAKGDSQAKLFSEHYLEKIRKYTIAILNIIIALKNSLGWILFFFLIYSYWKPRINRVYQKMNDRRVLFLIPLIIIVMDIAKITGFIAGKLTSKEKN